MILERLRVSIKVSEGYRQHPYKDTLGFWTVGYGHLIHHDVLNGWAKLGELLDHYSQRQLHDKWLESDIAEAVKQAERWIGPQVWASLGDVRRETIAEMRFQLGPKLSQFLGLKNAIDSGDWHNASEHMLDSLWARQTPKRAERLASRMRTGAH